MITVVCGAGRCGTSMMMRMLCAGDLEVLADEQAGGFEDGRATELPGHHTWLLEAEGKAVKVLDPGHFRVPPQYDARFIYLVRDPAEQAKSQLKFLRAIFSTVDCSRQARKRMAAVIERERVEFRRAYAGRPVLELHFEQILRDPMMASLRIGDFLGRLLDFPKMAAQVLRRGPQCQPGLEVETEGF